MKSSTIKKTLLSLFVSSVGFSAISCSNEISLSNNSELISAGSNDKGFLANRVFDETGDTIIKVYHTNKKQVTTLNELGMDVWMVEKNFVIGQVPQHLLDKVKKTNLKIEMLSPKEGFSVRNNFDPQYMTYDEMLVKLRSLESQYPNLAKLFDIGDTWEKTKGIANRDIWIMRLTGKSDNKNKPGIVFLGNHHARELVTVEIPVRLIEHLLSNYGKDPDITNMVDNTEIWIAPMINPDGHSLAEQGANWRKNKNTNKDISANARMGVDLNRNYAYKWASGGSSSDTGSETFHGKVAFSEPETQAVRDFIKSKSNLKIMMSYHSFSNLILWPWGWTNSAPPDANKIVTIGKKLGAMSGYKPQQAADLYIASGITDDWTYGELKILSYTTEIGSWSDGFDPPYSKMEKFWKENLPNALYLIKLANNPDASFGADIDKVSSNNGKITVNFKTEYNNPVSKIEYFVGTPGKEGTGTSVNVDSRNSKSISFDLSPRSGSLIYVRAQSTNGKWGPLTVGKL
jgi:carboxypeptidase T